MERFQKLNIKHIFKLLRQNLGLSKSVARLKKSEAASRKM